MIEYLKTRSFGICFKEMEHHDYDSRDAAQSVEDFKTRL